MKVGIFSGTFDPVHEGHISFVQSACDRLRLDRIHVIVERTPKSKRPHVSVEHRYAMVSKAFGHMPALSVRMSDAHTTKFSDIEDLFLTSEVYVLIGSDVAQRMKSWDGIEEWAPLSNIVVGLRSATSQPLKDTLKQLNFNKSYIIINQSAAVTSSNVRDDPSLLMPSITRYAHKHRLYT